MTWSVESSITATASDNLATTNKLAAKAEEAKAQKMSSKDRRALLIMGSLLKPPGVDLDGVTPCFRCAGANSKELCLILIATTSSYASDPVVRGLPAGSGSGTWLESHLTNLAQTAEFQLRRRVSSSKFRESLLLWARITKINPGLQAARYWGGLSAGGAIVEIAEDILDERTNAVLITFRQERR